MVKHKYCLNWYENTRIQCFQRTWISQPKTPKLQHVCWHVVTTCYNKPISGCVRMACDSLTTSLLQVVNRVVARCQQTCCKLIICTGLLQLVSTSCNKSANDKLRQAWFYNRLVVTWWNWQVCWQVATSRIGCVPERHKHKHKAKFRRVQPFVGN